MKLNETITFNSRFIHMNISTIQQLISHNKVQIRNLQTESDYLKYLISNKYWPNCSPSDFGVISQKSYEMLNRAKDDLRKINKQIKLLAELQYSLKYSIR